MKIETMDKITLEIMKKKSPEERLKISFEMWSFAREQLKKYLENENQEWDEEKINKEIARRFLGEYRNPL